MHEVGVSGLDDYLKLTESDESEKSRLVSALSIHTTGWFRENPHFVMMQRILLKKVQGGQFFKLWSCACSTGEEVYSFALLCEEFRRFYADFSYSVLGTDIDPVSLETARKALYPKKHLVGPVSHYKKHILLGSDKTEGLFTFSKALRQHCEFKIQDLRSVEKGNEEYDVIVCRNVLIYFEPSVVDKIIETLVSHLRPGGHLILGHAESLPFERFGLRAQRHAVYWKPDSSAKVLREPPPNFAPEVILIGASAGGPQALSDVLSTMPANCPPVVIVIHIESRFSNTLLQTVSQQSGLRIGEVRDGSPLKRGHVYCADGDYHLAVEASLKSGYVMRCLYEDEWKGYRPSVDVLFRSALPIASKCIGIILSGMGQDGADALEELHRRGAYTMAQSGDDAIVFGMPRVAIQRDAADFIGTGHEIHNFLLEIIQRPQT